VALQLFFARRLALRLKRLKQHLARLEHGQLDEAPAPDDGADEVAALRKVLAGATVRLKQARMGQERLLAEAAHELRTPLTLMRTSLDLALRRERTVDELHVALKETRTEVDRLARLATNLLELGAAERSWDLSQGDLMELLDDATEAARAEAEHRGLWFEVVGARPWTERFSVVALRQAVDNLIANALRFAPRGTAVRLEVGRGVGVCTVTVSDEGPGISPEQRAAVFAPFHRGDMSGGSGLGLAIVSEVARLHGGRAYAAEPTNGRGARVVIELPCAEPSLRG
jgi:signal transduction histidine kinase